MLSKWFLSLPHPCTNPSYPHAPTLALCFYWWITRDLLLHRLSNNPGRNRTRTVWYSPISDHWGSRATLIACLWFRFPMPRIGWFICSGYTVESCQMQINCLWGTCRAMLGAGSLLPQSLQQITTKASRRKLAHIINLIQETLKRPLVAF